MHQKKVSVIGAARSGLGVAKLLRSKGARVFVSDQQSEEKLRNQLSELAGLGIEYEAGGHSDRVYDCSLLVISPGVPSNAPVVMEAGRRGIRTVSELEVAGWFCKSPIVGVTGSNGKTTTTTLVGRILADARVKHRVAGNIGTAFSAVVEELSPDEVAVLEVSSFQLDHCESFRPKIAVLLNVTEDHMDRYDHSMKKYAASKARIFMNQTKEDTLIYCKDDEWTGKIVKNARSDKIPFGYQSAADRGAFVEGGTLFTMLDGKRTEIIRLDEMTIKGVHNAYNAMAAVLTGQLFGVGPASMRATLRNFKGVEHRLEFVKEVNGIKYYNDSKATNVDSVWYALHAFKEPIVLILGGRDKGNDYTRLHEPVRQHVKAIVAIGESADRVENSFHGIVPVHGADSMGAAVRSATKFASNGDVVLLSPACASFDWFENYEHRGKIFKELVNTLEQK